MSNLPTIKIKFYLSGDDFLKEDISVRLGVSPDEFRTKNDWPDAIKNNENLPDWLKPRTIWRVDVKEEHSYAVSEQFEKMMNLLGEKRQEIINLREELNLIANFEVVINMEYGDRPEMVLTKEVINFVSSLDAEIGFDMYIYGDKEEEEEF